MENGGIAMQKRLKIALGVGLMVGSGVAGFPAITLASSALALFAAMMFVGGFVLILVA